MANTFGSLLGKRSRQNLVRYMRMRSNSDPNPGTEKHGDFHTLNECCPPLFLSYQPVDGPPSFALELQLDCLLGMFTRRQGLDYDITYA